MAMKRLNKFMRLGLCILLINIFCLQNVQAVFSEGKGNKSEGRELIDTRYIDYNGVKVNVIIDRPESDEADVLFVFHGTAIYDSNIIRAAETMLKNTKKIVKRKNIVIISVAYPEQGLLFGDNIKEAEAALLWTKHNASKELGIKINKIYLLGHSQGGYLVTRLNTMYKTDGVIANGAGPIDLSYECKLNETGNVQGPKLKKESVEAVCGVLRKEYGSVFENPAPYRDRSLINFTSGYKSRIIFIQGMKERGTQMILYSGFKEKVSRCTDCAEYKFSEIETSGHGAAFENSKAIEEINNFLSD